MPGQERKDPREGAEGTLGALLYAQTKATPSPEREWAALVQSIAAGDQGALQELYARAHRPAYTLIMRILRQRATAEEVTLDVFHDVWRRASRYDPASGTVLGWIMNQARSRALDRLRHDRRLKRSPAEALPPAVPRVDSASAVEHAQRISRLRDALAMLPARERAAIETTFLGERTHADAAAHLEQPLGTLKTRIRTGLGKLRAALDEEGR